VGIETLVLDFPLDPQILYPVFSYAKGRSVIMLQTCSERDGESNAALLQAKSSASAVEVAVSLIDHVKPL